MERKTPFVENEYYHIYSRGVEKRKIFLSTRDYERFMALLYIMNQNDSFRMDNFLKGKKLQDIFKEKRSKVLVSIVGYCLMPNHFHLILNEHTEGGISKFMGKLLTAYSMYFNTKYERSGPLVTHPFRSEHIDDEAQFLYIFSYVHLNPLSILQKGWKENGIKNPKEGGKFLANYEYSSYLDFLAKERIESAILDFNLIPEYLKNTKHDFETHKEKFQKGQ